MIEIVFKCLEQQNNNQLAFLIEKLIRKIKITNQTNIIQQKHLKKFMGKGHMKSALQLAGSQHRYQTGIVILLSVAWILANLMFLSSTYIFMQPIFTCQKQPKYKFHQVQACDMLGSCIINDEFSLTAQMALFCQFEDARIAIQSIFPIGSFIGLILVNLLSDTKGRKVALQVTFSISIVGIGLTVFGGMSRNILSLIIAQFMLGFGSYPILPLGYTILYDFVSDSYRPIAVIIVNSVGGFATFSLGVFYLLQITWLNLLIIFILLPLTVSLIVTSIFLEQSPYILMNRNLQQQALQVLQKIATTNNRQQNIQQIRRIIEAQSVRDSQNQANLQNVYKKIKEWKYLKSIILITLIYGITNLNFYGISYSIEEEGLGFGINSILSGCVQMGAFLFLKYTVKKFPRRIGIAGFYSIVLVIGLCFLSPTVKNSVFLSTLLIGISKMASTNAYCLIACMETESFSVSIQSTAAGIIQAFALYGALFAPMIVNLASKIGIDPIAMIALFVNFGIWPTFFLRETFHKSNPQTQGPLFKHLKDYGQEMSDLTSVTSEFSSKSV